MSVVFEPDYDSDGHSIEVYHDEGSPMMDLVARLDLFAGYLYMEGGPTLEIPATMRNRDDCEDWVRNKLAIWRNIR